MRVFNQYAVVPSGSELTLQYAHTWPVSVGWTGLECREFTEEQRQEILSLGGLIFADPNEYFTWLHS
jgi:hypothetical protein